VLLFACLLAMDEEADGEPEISPEQMVNELPQHPDTRRQIRIKYRTLLNDVSSEYQCISFSSILC